jgi:phenylacetate-CoA ligase
MHALALIYVLREAPGVQQFRVVQNAIDRLDVEVVAGDAFTPAVHDQVVAGLARQVGPAVRINLQRRAHIAPLASGKHACVVSRVEVGA